MKRTFLPWALGVIVVALIGIALHANRSGSGAGTRDRDLVEAIDRLTQSQADLANRLERIEGRRASGAPHAGLSPRSGMGAAEMMSGGPDLSPAEQIARRDKALRAAEDRFASEPISPQWATRNERRIEQFLDKDSMAKHQLPVPTQATSACRSKTCRIGMVFADETQAEQTSASLFLAIGETLPVSQSLLLPGDDGTMRMLIFAQAPDSRR